MKLLPTCAVRTAFAGTAFLALAASAQDILQAIRQGFGSEKRAIDPQTHEIDAEKFTRFTAAPHRKGQRGRLAQESEDGAITLSTASWSLLAGLRACLDKRGQRRELVGGAVWLDSQERLFVGAQRRFARACQNHPDPEVRQAVQYVLGPKQGLGRDWESSDWQRAGFRLTAELSAANRRFQEALQGRPVPAQ